MNIEKQDDKIYCKFNPSPETDVWVQVIKISSKDICPSCGRLGAEHKKDSQDNK